MKHLYQVSYRDCDAEFVEGLFDQIQPKYRDKFICGNCRLAGLLLTNDQHLFLKLSLPEKINIAMISAPWCPILRQSDGEIFYRVFGEDIKYTPTVQFVYRNGQLVGFIEFDEKQQELLRINILPQVRSSGIGSILLDLLEVKRVYVEKENIRARNFYKKNGFQEISFSLTNYLLCTRQ